MNWLDFFIVLLLISSLLRGFQIGFLRQALSTLGFVGGLLLGSYLGTQATHWVHSTTAKQLLPIVFLLGGAFLFLSLGETFGIRLKEKIASTHTHYIDSIFGSVISIVTAIFGIWLGASILLLAPAGPLQKAARNSAIITSIDRTLPPANSFLSVLNRLIDPNGFPQVFTGHEPSPQATYATPGSAQFDPIVAKARPSIVKVEGLGCGGIVDGSGFVFAPNHVATNAHVVAGVRNPKVKDASGVHNATTVFFDPSNDVAVLAVDQHLAGQPLPLKSDSLAAGTAVLVAGYPGGGDFASQTAVVLDRFTALGRDIYNSGTTSREVYSLQAGVVKGNSGGPVLDQQGNVVGIVFATSTTYNNVGYALTTTQVAHELSAGASLTSRVPTGQCSE